MGIKERAGMQFCPDCGAALEVRRFENRQRSFCPLCRRIHYAQLKVGAGALIEQDGTLLLIRRSDHPFKGCWNLPAGYAEADEAPPQTVVREVFEETGLRVEPEGLTDVIAFDDDPRGSGILIVYKCRVVGGGLRATREGRAPTFFGPGDLPEALAGGGHDQAIRAWRNAQRSVRQGRVHPRIGCHPQELPGHSTLLAGREPPDEAGFRSKRLQIWYNNQDTSWVGAGEPHHKHARSDECFIVLRGTLVVALDQEQFTVGPREFCCFPAGVYHAIVEVYPPVETLMIRAPSIDDKVYCHQSRQEDQ